MTVYTDYAGVARELVHAMKFGHFKGLAVFAGELIGGLSLPHTEAFLPVPLSKERLIKRGFNQSYVIAHTLSRKWGVPVLQAVRRVKNTPPQSELGRAERFKNIKGAFSIEEGISLPRCVTIVDDVMTTGATLNEIARLLKQKGVITVKAILFARTPEE